MPKVSVYLPDELYRQAREQDLPLSTLTQDAVAAALRTRANDAWIERAAARPTRSGGPLDTARLLDEVREEFGA